MKIISNLDSLDSLQLAKLNFKRLSVIYLQMFVIFLNSVNRALF